MEVLVTGATGFLGHALTLDLVAAGHEVSALSRSADADGRLPATVHVAPCRPLDETAPVSAIEGVDATVHLAGQRNGFVHRFGDLDSALADQTRN